MMKPTAVIKNLLVKTCVYYTATALLFLLLNLIVGQSTAGLVSVVNFLLLFPFSFSLSGAHCIYTQSKLPAPGRLLLHFLISIAAFFLFLFIPSNTTKSATTVLIALLLVTVLYWFCYLIAKVTAARFHSYREE